jgi:hypothetical protein
MYLMSSANTRTGVATVFASEIRNVCNVMYILGLHRFTKQDIVLDPLRLKDIMLSRNEDYFETFSRNVDKLSGLPNKMVADITGFFTYLKASRDAVLAMQHWTKTTPEGVLVEDMQRILNQLLRCLENADAVLEAQSFSRDHLDRKRVDCMARNIRRFLGEAFVDLNLPPPRTAELL